MRLRLTMKPYIKELAQNVTARGVPTMRPLWYLTVNNVLPLLPWLSVC